MEESENSVHTIYTSDGQLLVKVADRHSMLVADEVYYLENFSDLSAVVERTVRMDFNAVVQCRRGRIEMEVGGDRRSDSAAGAQNAGVDGGAAVGGRQVTMQSKKVVAKEGQVLLLPANKLLLPMMVSTDVEVSVLLVSDRVLREVLGPRISLWNRAMFLEEIYVIDGGIWIDGARNYARTLFGAEGSEAHFRLFRDIVLSFLRTMFLMICELLARRNEVAERYGGDSSTTFGERSIFDRFLLLLSQEDIKRRQVSYYAARLNITPKYLSTVCKRVSGKSPMRWISESVMEEVYDLLRNSDLTVKEISNKLMFPNSSFFGQYFREQTGMTPLEYRKKTKGGRA